MSFIVSYLKPLVVFLLLNQLRFHPVVTSYTSLFVNAGKEDKKKKHFHGFKVGEVQLLIAEK